MAGVDEIERCALAARPRLAPTGRACRAVVATRDASGLRNPAVWVALERKGLIRSMYPHGAVVTPLGLDYETGLREVILHMSGH